MHFKIKCIKVFSEGKKIYRRLDMLQIKSKKSATREFKCINKSLKQEYEKQQCAQQVQKKWKELYKAILTDKTLTEEEKEKIISACHQLNLVNV